MKKSKFLKKSLAMLLAVMLVVAMIPLSAAAAVGDYEPIGAPELVASGDVSFSEEPAVSGNTITLVYNYDADNTPAVTIRTTGTQEKVRYLTEEGKYEVEEAPVEINLWEKDDAPADVTFWIVDPEDENNTSDAYTIKWSMEEPSSEATITSAKLDDISGVVNNTAATIEFTVPYGYEGDMALEIKTNDTASLDTEVTSFTGTVETNKKKGTPMTVVLRAQDLVDPQPYTITVKEADALTAISIGDVAGEIEIATADASDYDKGYETGTITFNMPADTAKVDNELNLIPTFTIGSAYEKVELNNKEIKSGEEFDFAGLLDAGTTGLSLVITSPDNTTRNYTLKMVVDGTSTAITGFTVEGQTAAGSGMSGYVATGVVNGTALSAEMSSNTDLTKTLVIKLNVATGATVYYDGSNNVKSVNGVATITRTGYTAPLTYRVVSPDGSRQASYTLTITKAEDPNKNPQISSGKLTIDKGTNDEAEYTASISGNTITFTVPYSTTKTDITASTTTVYTWAKTAQTTEPAITLATDPFASDAVNTVAITSDGGDVVTYKLVFTKEAAKTGKSISDFILTEATNTALVEYKTTYDVTASGTQFNVTLPQSVIDSISGTQNYWTNFTLSEGAKFYEVDGSGNLTEITTNINKDTGAFQNPTSGVGQIDLVGFLADGQKYLIVDEYLAYEISGKTLSTIQSTAKYDNHYTVYTVKATGTNRTGTALTSLSANDGLVTSTISGRKVTINVPASYAEAGADPFFFDFTISDGASLEAGSATLINGGDKEMSTDNKVINSAANNSTNPAFTVTYNSGDKKYELRLGSSTGTVISALTVKAENNVTVPYTVEVKVNAAETGALLTSVKVNNTSASINNTAKTVTVALPYGTNLGQVKIDMKASDMATIVCRSYDVTNPDEVYDLTKGLRITVISESLNTVNEYTLTATTAAQFSDVNTGDWFYQNVMDAVAAGIVSGRGDGTFGPNDRITRRDFAIMVSKLLLDGEDAPEATTTPFSDVAANDYGLNAIAYCAENGIISGFDGEFRPSDNITRQEAASVMKNALELTGTTSELFADDAAIATWAKANVYACKAAGVFNGDDHNNFNPTSTLTRAEAASIMVNAMK